MKLLIVSPSALATPPFGYGGMERAVGWLCDGLSWLGVDFQVVCKPGSTVQNPIFIDDELEYGEIDLASLGVNCIIDFSHTKSLSRANPNFNQINVWQVMTKTWPINPVFISQGQKTAMVDKSDGPVIYYGLNHLEFPPNIGKPREYLLYMGAILRTKRVHWAMAVARMTESRLKVAGPVFDGNYVKTLEFNDDITYVGEASGVDKLELLRNASALIHPVGGDNWVEAGAIVVLEALASGTPVVATRNGCLPEYIVPGENGYLGNTIEDLCAGVNKIWRIKRSDCVNSTREFTASRMAREYLTLAKTVIGGARWM